MALFAVIRRRTEAWGHGRPLEAQQAWREHAAFMDALQAEGVCLLAGPLEEYNEVLLIFRADSAEAVQSRLLADPWTELGLLETLRIAEWTVRIGSPG